MPTPIKAAKGVSLKMGKHKSRSGGLTAAGVAKYNRETGSNLKTAVTTPPSKLKKGSKAAKRRKSFCARMKGEGQYRSTKWLSLDGRGWKVLPHEG